MENNFTDILRNYVLKQRQKNPSVSESTISKKMNIPPTTFNRLMNGHPNPNLKTIIKLIEFVPELRNFLPEEISQILEVSLERKNKAFVESILSTILSDKYVFLCWVMTFSNKGVSEKEVKDQLGVQGLKSLRLLEEKNIILKDKNNCYKIKEPNKDTILSFELIKTHLMYLAEQYDSNNLRDNYIHYRVEFLSEKGKRGMLELHREFHRKIRDFTDNEENKGDLPVFSIACNDSLFGNKEDLK